MKLLGRDIPARELIARIEERLRTRGLPTSEPVEVPPEGVEPRVEPLTFNLHALEEHADATRALPLHTHRGGVGQLVVVAKWAFRKSCQVFINEALGRQRVFNGHVRDSYAQLSAEVLRLRREVEQLRARQAAPALVAEEPTKPPRPTPSSDGDLVLPKPRTATAKPPEPSKAGRAPSSPMRGQGQGASSEGHTRTASREAPPPQTDAAPLAANEVAHARGRAGATARGAPPATGDASRPTSHAAEGEARSSGTGGARRDKAGQGARGSRADDKGAPAHRGDASAGRAGKRSGKGARRPKRR